MDKLHEEGMCTRSDQALMKFQIGEDRWPVQKSEKTQEQIDHFMELAHHNHALSHEFKLFGNPDIKAWQKEGFFV